MNIKKGSFFALTNGCYSDYEMVTICKATQDIDVSALHDEYLSLRPEQAKEFRFKDDEFIKWLIVDKKVCKELDYFEWHLGNYSDGEFSLDERKRT